MTSPLSALPAPEALIFDLDGVLADIYARTALVVPEVLAALAERWPIGVVTTCPRQLAESVLSRHGLREFVGALVTTDDGPTKPDPAPVRLAVERLASAGRALAVERAWMLGDNPSDVEAARGAGCIALAIEPHGIGAESHRARLESAGATAFVADVATLAGALLQR